jgi:cyclase
MNNPPTSVIHGVRQSFPPDGLVAQSRVAYQNTPLEIKEIRPDIFVFIGGGGTVTAIAASGGGAVIDTGYGLRVDEIRKGIASALRQEPRFLIDTHWHFDHTDGNSVFAAHGTSVVAHVNCRARLSREQYVPSLEWRVPASLRDAWPEIVFEGPVTIDLHSEALRLLPQAPAHTDGDTAVLLPSANVLVLLGDLFTNSSYPVIDESSGGSLRGMIEALERLLTIIDSGTAVVPGHGPMGNRRALIDFRDMLHGIEDRILELVNSGSTPSEICRADRGPRSVVRPRVCHRRSVHSHGLGRPPPGLGKSVFAITEHLTAGNTAAEI